MKNLFLILFFFLVSCSNNESENIKDIEDFLGVNMPATNIQVNSSNEGFRQSLKIVDITLNINDYNQMVKKINLKEFEKYGDNYYRNSYSEKQDKKIYVILFTREHRIRYAEKG
ncbi:hypothetical protein R1T16_12455 [Flavobacterium sp. DG1-102-2]|uniref:hypothetical protein n=1 Tax=Flavobacterium sp. DG1-102-2 TaxID=3081663 RepID=UPI0029496ACC|nr:hypothetical protein [Flavobacterium sp. DG1-102-2]MDV6169238.1 hypothetical protein [Flavobacterium sp. DG1-102-2]